MNRDIADILKGYITGLNFIDKLGGMAQIGYFTQAELSKKMDIKDFTWDGMQVIKLPIVPSTPPKYEVYCMDKGKKSIIFFEDLGTTSETLNRDYTTYVSKLKLICWFDQSKLNALNTNKSQMIQQIIQAIDGEHANDGIFNRIYAEFKEEDKLGDNIFSNYDIDIAMIQYLMYPYDAFGLTFEVGYAIGKDCVSPIEIDPLECFPKNNLTECL
jgi:hypothetical protein